MTATQSLTRRAIGALRRLNDELLASGEAMARTARAPQPRPQAGPAGTTPRAARFPGHAADDRLTRPPAQALPALLHI
jgi:hypothetical protein